MVEELQKINLSLKAMSDDDSDDEEDDTEDEPDDKESEAEEEGGLEE